MVRKLTRKEWQKRRKKYPRVEASLTVDEAARWNARIRELGQSSAERLRRLIQIDIAHRSVDPLNN